MSKVSIRYEIPRGDAAAIELAIARNVSNCRKCRLLFARECQTYLSGNARQQFESQRRSFRIEIRANVEFLAFPKASTLLLADVESDISGKAEVDNHR